MNIARLRVNFEDPENIEATRFYVSDLGLKLATWYEHANTFTVELALIP